MVKLNLGSGAKPLDHHFNIDINPKASDVHLVCDLDVIPWPLKSDAIDEIVMNQCLEHLKDHNKAMAEVYRVLRKGGKAKISVPHFTWQFAYHDPTHRHFFGYNTFFYYTGRGGYFDFKFSTCEVMLTFGKRFSKWNRILEPLFNKYPNVYEQSILRIFPALTVEAVLTK